MLRAGYDPKLACGTICASGTLGQIIPPSIVLVFLGDILQGANTRPQLRAWASSRPHRSRSATCSPARSCPAWCWWRSTCFAWPGRRGASPSARPPLSPRGRARGRCRARSPIALLPPAVLILARARLDPGRHRDADRIGRAGRDRRAAVRGAARPARPRRCCARSCAAHRDDHLDGVRDPARRLGVLAGVPRPRRRRRWSQDALRGMPGGGSARCWSCMAVMFLLGFFLDFFEIVFVVVPIVGAGAAGHGRRPGLARRHDGGQPADQLPDAAVRLRAVLPARRGAAEVAHHRTSTAAWCPSSPCSC